ncbi:hypothetical protein EKA85_10400 [Pseudomonas veronii]|uniref:hypothetical protein n=1 Tax=Pseudomonas veronii TaxID=76761 RepID=UPI000F8477D9|nr:hypothetical protein [Pseudomonas veronii]RTY68066.1 hypothetical protein EKA85_10400 [Pseudomonas veronii]
MANSVGVDGYIHIEGFEKFEREAFDKKKIRAAMRKAGKLVRQRAQMNIALARGQDSYPLNRTGALLGSINFKVSRSGFMVKVAPYKTGAMKDYYPAYLHYGVRQGSRIKKLAPGEGRGKSNRRRSGARAALVEARKSNGWRIEPRANYMSDALQDSGSDVRAILSRAFADALG